jgi:TPR repeat protein
MKRVGGAFAFAATCGLVVYAPAAPAQLGLTARLDAQTTTPSSTLTAEQAARRYNLAESFERRHDLRSAFDAYSQAGEAGHPLAQKRLGDIYSTGNAAVPRDYEAALRWYQRARAQGVEIPAPFTYPGTPSGTLR